MPQDTNLNISPYFDDFNESKNYYKVLFKPGYPVQARELTTLQSIFQNQIEKFANHTFKEGSVVIPGQTNYNNQFYSVQLEPEYLGIPVRFYIDNIVGKIIKGETSKVQAKIISVLSEEDSLNENVTIFVSYTASGDNNQGVFLDNEKLIIDENIVKKTVIVQAGEGFANTIQTNSTSVGSAVILSEGVYYIRGTFVNVSNQVLILDPYNNQPSYKVGFDIKEEIITSDEDESLSDNAQGFTNYAAPGADRFKITATLSKKPLDSTNNENFISLLDIKEGVLISTKSKPQYSVIQDEIARRTFDESGDYYVRPFDITPKETLTNNLGNNGLYRADQLTYNNNVPRESLATYKISPGKAYVRGYEVSILSSVYLDFDKPRTTKKVENESVNYVTGSTYTVNRVYGSPKIDLGSPFIVSLRDQRVGASQTSGNGKEIGLARVYDFALESGAYDSSNPNLNQWDLSLFDIQTYSEIVLNEPINLTTPVHIKGKSSGASGYLRYDVVNSGIVTAYNITGSFAVGEKFIFNGTETDSRVSVAITEFSNKDVRSVSQLNGSTTIFSADIIPSLAHSVGFSKISKNVSGISTVSLTVDNDFTFINKVKEGGLISYRKPNGDLPTLNRVLTVQEKTITVAGITSVSGVCDGSLPTSETDLNELSILASNFQPSPDNTLFTSLPRPYISSVDLTDSSITIRKEYPITITSGQSSTVTADSGETFLPFDEERYILVRSNGAFEVLTQDKFVFTNASKELTIYGLGSNDPQARLIATLRKVNIKSKTKIKNRINSIVLNRSRYDYSGIGSTTVNDGLEVGNFPYGTRVQDEEICLMVPEITRVYGILESSGVQDPLLPTVSLSTLSGPTGTVNDLIPGEEFIGRDSGAVAIYVGRINDLKAEFSYLNNRVLQQGEIVKFRETGIEAVVGDTTLGDKSILPDFSFDYGQKETIYDYAKLIRKPEAKEPTKKIRIIYESASFASSDTGDITTADSYNQFDYCTVTFAKESINNTDIIDARPRVSPYNIQTANRSPFEFLARSFTSSGNSAKNVLASDESIVLSYSYYLPRIDKIFLTKDGTFQLVKGEPSEIPQAPQLVENALEVATVTLPPYLCDASRATVNITPHKRYQMKDISKLEERIKNLESYTTLNLLETNTENLKIKDANGLDRFKSGFFVDDFTTTTSQSKITIVKNSIDSKNGELRPAPYTTEVDLLLGSSSLVGIGTSVDPNADPRYVTDLIGNNIKRTGQMITLDYEHVVQVQQPFATRTENVTPYLVTRYNGTIELYPSSDTWVDQVRADAKNVEIDNFTQTQQQLVAAGWDPQTGYSPITWGAWETTWTGETTTYNSYWNGYYYGWPYYGYYGYGYPYYYGYYGYPYYHGYWGHYYGWWGYGYPYYYYGYPWGWYGGWGSYTTVATTTKTGTSTREGTRMQLTEQVNTYSQGDSIIATDFISYMRSRNVEFTGKRFKPFTQVYAFFDGEDVNEYIVPKLLEITMNSGTFEVGETVIGTVMDSSTFENPTIGVTPTQIVFRTAVANHRYGPYNEPTDIFTANPYNSTSTTSLPETYSPTSELLNIDTYSLSEQAQGDFYGYLQKGMVLRGQTSGAEAVVRNIRLFTDQVGTVIGSFFIPNPNVPTNPTFETGTKSFRLTNSDINSQIDGVTSTSGEANYYAQGILNTIQETIVSVRSANITSEKLTESKQVSETTTSVSTNVYGWYGWPYNWRYHYGRWGYCYWDPLAQSFFVEEEDGVFITKVDLYFRTKDPNNLPVTIQMRPMSMGVPKTDVYPFSEIVVEPKDIKVSEDASVATTVHFPSPVYLKGGEEHALILLSESNEYTVWISRLGETDVSTLSQPESQRIVVTQQVLLGSLFKSQNGSTWDPSQYEDLKFTLYKAKFSTSPGDINFYNPDLNVGNKQIANLVPNSLNFTSRKIRVGLGTTVQDPGLELGNTIIQMGSNASGNYVGYAGSAFGNMNIINAGIGYSNGYYANVPLVNLTGTGKNATANITISNGSIVALGATISQGGSGYKIGDIVTVSSLGGTPLGRNIRLSISDVKGINQLILDQVQGDFSTGVGKTVQYISSAVGVGSTNINASIGGNVIINFIDVESEESDGLHVKVNHKNHGMHAKNNRVEIKDAYSDIRPSTLATVYLSDSTDSINLTDMIIDGDGITGTSAFANFENLPVSATNPGYIIIDREIISYEGIDGTTLTGITRGIDQTKSFTHPPGSLVFKYEVNGISLRRINKIHDLQDVDIAKSINLDSYFIKIDTSAAGKTEPLPYGQVDRSVGTTTPKLYSAGTKSAGGANIYATQNIAYEIVKPIIQTMDLTGTNLTGKIRTVSGTSADGNEESYVDQGYEPISIDENTYLKSPRIIASKINEQNNLTQMPGNKSFTMNLKLSTSNENLSPVIDLDRVGMIFTSNRVDSIVDDFATDVRVSTIREDPSSFVYATNPITLGVPATAIKIIVGAHVNKYNELRALYAVMKDPSEEPIYYPFPGYNNIYESGQVIDISKSDGRSDFEIEKTDGNGFISTELVYRDYEFTIDNLPDFKHFSIKFVGTSENQAYPPRLRSLRVIALA